MAGVIVKALLSPNKYLSFGRGDRVCRDHVSNASPVHRGHYPLVRGGKTSGTGACGTGGEARQELQHYVEELERSGEACRKATKIFAMRPIMTR